jgi:hypothetical protein
MKECLEPVTTSQLRKTVGLHPTVQMKRSGRPTFMANGRRISTEVTDYDIGQIGWKSNINLPSYFSSPVFREVGDAKLVRNGAGEQYLTRLHIKDKYRDIYPSFAMAALILAAENALEEGDVFRTDPAGEYRETLNLWDQLITAGVAKVVDEKHFQPNNESQTTTQQPLVLRDGYYQIVVPTVQCVLTSTG